MPSTLTYLERTTGEESPFSFGCSLESGRASGLYLLSGVTDPSFIGTAIQELLGDVADTVQSGQLNRILPRAHPYLPWYVAGISSFRGVGGNFIQVTNTVNPLSPQLTQWCLYNQYHITVDFQPRMYPVFDNIYVQLVPGSWFKDNGASQSFTFANEWERFTDIEIAPSPDSVTVQIGQMAFNAVGLPQDAKPFTAMPKMFLNNEMIKLTWYAVPMRYYTSDNSYLRRFRGRVNQNAWNTLTFGNYQPGELLYLGCNLKRYTPPLANQNVVLMQGLYDFSKYCNIEIMLLYTKRPLGASALNTPTNKNYVVGGHNLNPYFGAGNEALSQTFLYTSTVPSAGTGGAALWRSFPLEILWTDPDDSGHI